MDFEAQPDFAAVAEASGCHGRQVSGPDDICPSLETSLKQNLDGVPAVLDFVVDLWDFLDGFKEFHPEIFG